MINELTTYIKGIQEQFPLQTFIKEPTRGLHIMFEVKDDKVHLYRKELYLPGKKEAGKASDFIQKECFPRELHIDYIESHKALIGKAGKKIHSATPFALKIRKKSFDEDWLSWLFTQKEATQIRATVTELEKLEKSEQNQCLEDLNVSELEKHALQVCIREGQLNKIKEKTDKNKRNIKLFQEKLETISCEVTDLLNKYFNRANSLCLKGERSENEQTVLLYQAYLIEKFINVLSNYSEEILTLSKKDDIFILLKNYSLDQYQSANSNYIKEYIFNDKDYSQIVEKEEYGLSNYINTASNNKPYLKHLTAPFNVNFRISQTKAMLLFVFERYRNAKAFKTNPLPIFIDKTELNETVINVTKKEGNDVKFNTIIRKLFEHSKNDLGNYYLLYFDYRGELKDLDFVSSFSFGIDLSIKKVLPTLKLDDSYTIKNVFDFELKILNHIFSNQLIKIKDDKVYYKYFDEIDNNPKYISATQWNLVMKYRKSFYDWVYKSRRQAVTSTMFHDILNKMILDDIRRDEYKEGYHSKNNDIINKLNILFSLWNYFNKSTQSNDLDMANKITELQERVRLIREIKGNDHIETDDEFAFTAGQIIFFLLDKSKASNKSHALLEPFLQKTNVSELKKAITSTFNAYKHEIDFGKGRFEKLCSEVMTYELDKNLKEFTPLILAGYFSSSTIYEKSNNT